MNNPVVVLIAEDEVLLRMLAHDILTDAGYSVVQAATADEALILLDARPDTRVLFTDVKMPGWLDGYGLANIVSNKHPDVRILVASGDHLPGASDLPPGSVFLQKPYSPSSLLGLIEDLIDPTPEAPRVGLEMPFSLESGPASQPMPAPVQEPEK